MTVQVKSNRTMKMKHVSLTMSSLSICISKNHNVPLWLFWICNYPSEMHDSTRIRSVGPKRSQWKMCDIDANYVFVKIAMIHSNTVSFTSLLFRISIIVGWSDHLQIPCIPASGLLGAAISEHCPVILYL